MKQLLRPATFTLLLFSLNLLTCRPAYSQNLLKEKLEFSPVPDFTAQFEWLDADGDQDLDVLVIKTTGWDFKTPNIRLYENKAGKFQEASQAIANPVDLRPAHYAFGDHDLDGDLDFLFQDYTTLRLARNNGNLSFTVEELAGFAPNQLAVAPQWLDVDGDADLDILYPNASPSYSLGVYLNHHNSFTLSPHLLSPILRDLSFADVNNDGLPDFVAKKGPYGVHPLYLHVNQGDGSFAMVEQELVPAFSDGQVRWADLDGDQDLDLFVSESDEKCTLFRNQYAETGTARFERAYQFQQLRRPRAETGDINQDGLPDLILSGEISFQPVTLLYLNQSSKNAFKFEEKNLQIQRAGTALDLVDLNRDLAPDLFLITQQGFSQPASFELHKSPVPGLLLAAPANLQTAVGEHVRLSWDPAAAAGSFYYQLELKRDGQLYHAPLSLADGSPLLSRHPGKQLAAGRLLRNLPAGTYHWRVQARDEAGRSSAFTGYQTFTIAPAPAHLELVQPQLTRVRLQWTHQDAAATGFAVFRRSAHTPLEKIAVLPAGSTAYEDTTLMTNQQYEYLVKADRQGALSAPSNVASVATPQFTEKSFGQRPQNLFGLGQSADLDQDGDYDLALMEASTSNPLEPALFKNDGTGTFTRTALLAAPETAARNFFVRDMDNDGDEDICALIGDYVTVFENTGGLFRKAFSVYYPQGLHQLAVEDFNHDGRPDLLFSHKTTNGGGDFQDYKILLQGEAFSFLPAKYRLVPEYGWFTGRFAVGDLNNDGFADILVGGSPYSGLTNSIIKARIFFNQGGNGFGVRETSIPGLMNFWPADFNLDGHLDIIHSRNALTELEVLEGTGDLNFKSPRIFETPDVNFSNLTEVQAADFDLNGYPDLLVSGTTRPTILQYQGPGQYAPLSFRLPGSLAGRTNITDFDNDGDLDLHHDGTNLLTENKLRGPGPFANQAPSAPAQVSVTLGRKTRIAWTAATDDLSPAGALTYNLRLQDAAGKVWLHPETNAAGTFRRRLGPGNAGNKTFFDFNDLPAGRYSVQVQALDAGFQLSAFSPVQTFEILPGPLHLALDRVMLNKIRLTWQATPPAASQLIVERRTGESDFEVIARLPSNSTTYTDEELSYNKVYLYRVYALVNGQPTAPTHTEEWKTDLFVLNTSPGLPELKGTRTEAGDYNNDGRLDLSVYGSPTQGILWQQQTKVLENTAAGWVAHPVFPGTVAGTSQLLFFDFNGDHQLDLFRFGSTDMTDKSELHFNQGNSVFQTAPSIFTSRPQSLLGWWDPDSDNDLDAYMADSETSWPPVKTMLQNNGNGNFTAKETSAGACGNCFQGFFTGDFDRDGDEDLLQHDYTSEGGSGYYFMQNNAGKLTRSDVVISTGSGHQVKVVDYNNDGWPDIFVLGDSYTNFQGKSLLYKNLGLDARGWPRFVKVQDQLPIGYFDYDSDWVDFDHDGDLDFFIGYNYLSIYINEGNDVFSEFKPTSLSPYQNHGQLFDFDHDGDLDIYLRWDRGWGEGKSPQGVVLVNQIVAAGTGIRNQAPQAPARLSAVQDEKGLHLSWDPATDDLTPAAGLSYDVILYRDGQAITKASVDPVSGNRQKLAFGRSPARLTLNNLAVGAYTWKVQAVDASYQGSALSAAGDFFFKPEPPEINDTLIYRCDQQITLQAKGQNIEWFRDAGLSVKLAAGTFRPQASQQVYVTQTIGGVRGVARKVTITIFERPDQPVLPASNQYTYCRQSSGSTLYLQATGENIRWYGDKALKNLVQTGSMFMAPAAETTYYVTQTIQNCESPAAEAVLRPAQIDTLIYQSHDTLYAAEKNGLSYHWYLDNRALSGGNKNYVKISQDGNYYVRIFKDGCLVLSQVAVVSDLELVSEQDIRVYPNPSPGDVLVQMPAGATTMDIKVADGMGRVVYQTARSRNTGTPLSVPAKNWRKGLYFFHITTNQGQVSKKVFIR